jgi:chromate transporter
MYSADLYDLLSFFGTLSLLSVGGGNTVIPDIHRHAVLVKHWLSDTDFIAIYAIAQSAPGPSSLLVALVGWKVAAWPGALVATIAMYTPSSIVAYIAGRSWQRFKDNAWRIRLENGLVPVTIGLIFASGWVVAQEAARDYVAYLITAFTAILVARTKINPLLIMLGAGIVGFLAWA